MRNAPNNRANRCRIRQGRLGSDDSFGNNGAFRVSQKDGPDLFVIASDGEGWDHVSVSVASNPQRCPTWEEMCLIKDLFFKPEECVLQYHPPQSEYVNDHAFCLHLWRKQLAEVELPPRWMVGPGVGPDTSAIFGGGQ